jgi:hypothetical protein
MSGVRNNIEAASPPPKGLCFAPSALASVICLVAVALATAVSGCGGGDAGKGFGDAVDKARAAQALSLLQTGLVTLALLQADSAGAAQDVVAALAAKDPTNRYTTAPPTETGVVQVVGGAGGPVMLVALGQAPADGQTASYVAAWQGGGTTMYYRGAAPPAYTTEPPAGAGWGSTLPQ